MYYYIWLCVYSYDLKSQSFHIFWYWATYSYKSQIAKAHGCKTDTKPCGLKNKSGCKYFLDHQVSTVGGRGYHCSKHTKTWKKVNSIFFGIGKIFFVIGEIVSWTAHKPDIAEYLMHSLNMLDVASSPCVSRLASPSSRDLKNDRNDKTFKYQSLFNSLGWHWNIFSSVLNIIKESITQANIASIWYHLEILEVPYSKKVKLAEDF